MRGRFTPDAERRGVVRAPAAVAHPPLHDQASARRDRAGRRARLPALPVRLAARRAATRGWQARTRSTRSWRQLEGFEAPAAAWESEILPARLADYDPAWLDEQCLAGHLTWMRLRAAQWQAASDSATPVRTTPIAILPRRHSGALDVIVAAANERRTRAPARRRSLDCHPADTAPRSSTISWKAAGCCARRSRKRSPNWSRSAS